MCWVFWIRPLPSSHVDIGLAATLHCVPGVTRSQSAVGSHPLLFGSQNTPRRSSSGKAPSVENRQSPALIEEPGGPIPTGAVASACQLRSPYPNLEYAARLPI